MEFYGNVAKELQKN